MPSSPGSDDLDALLAAVPAGGSVVLVSPHLDDAALSCGSVLTRPDGPRRVVVTPFTDPGPAPWPFMGRRIARAGGHPDPATLFADRRAEDDGVLATVGAASRHLGFVEAPYRRAPAGGRVTLGRGRPLYPTFRFDALRGRVSRRDGPLVGRLRDSLVEVLGQESATVVLAPLGVGLHVDHLLARDAAVQAASATGSTLVLYADYPYSSRAAVPRGVLRPGGPVPVERQRTRDEVVRLAGGYRTQFDVLFPGGDVPLVPERYWVRPALAVRRATTSR